MSFSMKIVIAVSGEKAKKLLKEHGMASIYACHGYSGTMISCEDEADYDRICEDEEYAEKRLIETTTNF